MKSQETVYVIREDKFKERCVKFISSLSTRQGYEVVIRPYKKIRSLDQNRLMWKWYGFIADQTGHSTCDLHEYMKGLWQRLKGGEEVYTEILGRKVKKKFTTKELSTVEMSEFLGYIEIVAKKLEVKLPPAEYYGLIIDRKRG